MWPCLTFSKNYVLTRQCGVRHACLCLWNLVFVPLSLILRNLTSKQWTNIHVNESVIDIKYQPIFTIWMNAVMVKTAFMIGWPRIHLSPLSCLVFLKYRVFSVISLGCLTFWGEHFLIYQFGDAPCCLRWLLLKFLSDPSR